MPVIINFKICDNARECGGISVCPTHAMYFDEKDNIIKVDKDKCINCGACEKACPVGAIRFGRTQAEFEKIKKEIDDDSRTIADLFVDRYGAMPIQEEYLKEASELNDTIKNTNIPLIIEINTDDTINCLLKSVPMKEILKAYAPKAIAYKFLMSPEELASYGIENTPCLRFYDHGKLIGEINEYFVDMDRKEYLDKIKTFLN